MKKRILEAVLLGLIVATISMVACGKPDTPPEQQEARQSVQKDKFVELQKLANDGNAEAQFQLGYAHYKGIKVPRDSAKAVDWYQKAAAQGNENAQCALGFHYATGEGVHKDIGKAMEWYQKAGDMGLNGLAWIYATSEDPHFLSGKKAVAYAQKAIEKKADNWSCSDTLAAAYARNGQFAKAVEQQNKAIALLQRSDDLSGEDKKQYLDSYEQRLKLYKNKKAYIDKSASAPPVDVKK